MQTSEPLPPAPAPARKRTPLLGVILFIALVVGAWAMRGKFPSSEARQENTQQPSATTHSAATLQPEEQPGVSLPLPSAPAFIPPEDSSTGIIVVAMADGLNTHLFAIQPGVIGLTRLTDAAWDDISPAISPDGTQIVYSSRQNGYWDLYVRSLKDGSTMRVTDTPQYEGAPSWSPDGQWLVFESYQGDNLEILLSNLTAPDEAPVALTEDLSSDHSPAWAPGGREIAFVSNRAGDEDIWVAHLDRTENRFENLTPGTGGQETHPAWSPDGRYLAWSTNKDGNPQIMVWDGQNPNLSPRTLASGDWPVWSPAGDQILARVSGPNQNGLTMYEAATGQLTSPLIDLPAEVQGLAWQSGMFADLLPKWLVGSALTGRPALYQAKLSLSPIAPKGRAGILPVPDVTAPYPYLQDSVDEAFNALRAATADTSGWDFLGNLENAYLPLTEPLRPGMSEEWLYTGRAFAVNPLPMQAGWMVVTRELFSGETYWRIWIKARYQDGSQGQPLEQSPWNLDARYTGDPISYEQGGVYTPVPSGYWIDFTELAQRFDWQRASALRNWRTFYPAARFNLFLQPGTLNWSGAMNEVYPVEALDPPTPIPTLTTTPVPTKTPRYNPSVTVEPTATITTTPTRRPTWTPPAPTSQP